ncbi:hypothetical protein YSA_07888 [Pseudomonas putida ND6]|uniref:Uncharacterized protein n=1 Tax=Pseudomonas putida ND6 TaxID=231023 RepID=I3UZW8_PSEPU|nr:hypothetical protein YSA_07888 [Pseudomonas putida ND6]
MALQSSPSSSSAFTIPDAQLADVVLSLMTGFFYQPLLR